MRGDPENTLGKSRTACQRIRGTPQLSGSKCLSGCRACPVQDDAEDLPDPDRRHRDEYSPDLRKENQYGRHERPGMGAAGVAVAGGFFKIALYVCVAVLIIWIGKVTYQFGYDIFNQHAMSPGEGQEVTVVIKEDATSYDIAKTLKSKGLIDNALVFVVQEKLSNYSGKMRPGTYLLSTAYTPNRIMGILAGDAEQEGVTS